MATKNIRTPRNLDKSTNNAGSPRTPEAHQKAGVQGKSLFEAITDKIIAVIEAGKAAGCINWAGQGGAAGMPRNIASGKVYQGINVLLMWAEAEARGYSSPCWLTYKQAVELGGNVKRGEKATMGIFWGSREIKGENDDSDEEGRQAMFSKAFYVFNLDQCEGVEHPTEILRTNTWDAISAAEVLIQRSGARIIEGGVKAFYRPSVDEIHMPDRDRFKSAENYYAVQLHELSHWTGHSSRLARDLKSRFGDQAYAMEELIAELGAAFLSAEMGITGQIEGHASYIKSWLKVLRNDPRAIVTAASKAGQAARWLIESPQALLAAA